MPRVPRALFEWLDLKRSIALIVIVGGGYAWYVYSLYRAVGPAGVDTVVARAATAAPLVGFLIAPALIGLVAGYFGWVEERIWTPWQGRYYAFDDHQIRVVEARDRLWFSSADIHAALGMKQRATRLASFDATQRRDDPEIGEVLSHAGLVRLLDRSTDRPALRLLAWAHRDVGRIWQKRRDAYRPSTTL